MSACGVSGDSEQKRPPPVVVVVVAADRLRANAQRQKEKARENNTAVRAFASLDQLNNYPSNDSLLVNVTAVACILLRRIPCC